MTSTIQSIINQRAEESPDRPFVIDPDAGLSMSFGELKERCRQFGNFLDSRNISPGDHVSFLSDNGYWTVVIMLGTIYSGRVAVPLNAVASIGNLAHVLVDSKTRTVFVSKKYRKMLDEIVSGLNKDFDLIHLGMKSGPDSFNSASGSDWKQATMTGSSTGLILYTSGTVGKPKGAVLSHENLVAGGRNVGLAHQISESDRALCVLPLYHINGEIVTAIAPLVTGSCVVMPRRFSVSKFWNLIEQYKCTWFSIVPTIAKYLLDQAHREPEQHEYIKSLEHLRFGRSATSALPASMHQDFEATFGIPMIETMGLTETAATILANPLPPAKRISGSVGLPFGDEVKIIDKNFNERAPNEVGEIIVRGPNVISSYYNLPDTTASSFTPDGWFRTGDLGYRDENGYFYVTGRIKELIIKGGENISPREIDDVLYLHKAVLEAAAFGIPDKNYGQEIAAAVVLRAGYSCSEEEIIEHCRSELGEYRTPSKILFYNDLPKGPSGKIQRLVLEKSFAKT